MLQLAHELRISDLQDCGPAYDDEDFGPATPEQELAEIMQGALDSLKFQLGSGTPWEDALSQAALCYGVDPQDLTDRYNAP